MVAHIIALASDPQHRLSKQARNILELVAGLGVEGDAHAGVTVQHGSKVLEGVPIALGQNAKMMFLHVDAARHGDNYNDNTLTRL